jgi:flavin-binding protein dodecin
VRGKQAEFSTGFNSPRFPFRQAAQFGRLKSMSNHIYKKIELVGSSPNSMEEAVQNAVAKAAQSLRNLRWFEVVETRGQIENDRIAHWQVTVKIGFTLED